MAYATRSYRNGQAASISKPVTAMVALHLVEAGLLDLDANANDVLHT
ncbi:MAG: serine hydrolase [Anaerolineae bacterium]|nr:serine hydrolase [Anaerolineae bacterium]